MGLALNRRSRLMAPGTEEQRMPVFLAIALAGAAGAAARYGLDLMFRRDGCPRRASTPPCRPPGDHDRPAGSVPHLLDPVAGDVPVAPPRPSRTRICVLARQPR